MTVICVCSKKINPKAMFRIAFPRADIKKKAIRYSMSSNSPERYKSFTHIVACEQAQLCEFGENYLVHCLEGWGVIHIMEIMTMTMMITMTMITIICYITFLITF